MLINSGTRVLSPTIRTEQTVSPPTKQSPRPGSAFGTFADTLIDSTFFAFNEIVEVGKNDPALALRYGATSISEKLLEGTGPTVRTGFDAAIIPTIRLSILGANAYRLNKTWNDPSTHLAEKGLDIARVATDLMGLAGSVLKYAMPSKAALGDTLVGVSYAADSVSHAVRLMTHGNDRVKVWKKLLNERKEANKREAEPVKQPDPIATPPVNTSAPTYLLAQ